jgi:anti-sigma factor RsiW
MNEPLSEELLSAYLDNELSDVERLRVEQWLADSPSHRRLLDDLQAIRRELQSLPKQSLDAGFSDRVLAAIRERNAGDRPASSQSPAVDPVVAPEQFPSPAKPAPHVGMPAWRWFAAGVAASLAAVLAGVNVAPEAMARVGLAVTHVIRVPVDAPQVAIRSGEKKELKSAPAKNTETEQDATNTENTEATGPASIAKLKQAARNRVQETPVPGDELPAIAKGAAGAVGPAAANSFATEAQRQLVADRTAAGAAPAPGESASGKPGRETPEQEAAKKRDSMPPGNQFAAPAFAAADARKAQEPAGQDKVRAALAENEQADGAKSDDVVLRAADPQAGDVPELAVTSEQAERALATFAQGQGEYEESALQSTFRRSARGDAARYSSDALARRENNGVADGDKQSGVQIAALEVTGTEAEVHSLLDALGVEQARNLRPYAFFAQDAGGFGYGGGGGAGGALPPAAATANAVAPPGAPFAGARGGAGTPEGQSRGFKNAAAKSGPGPGGGGPAAGGAKRGSLAEKSVRAATQLVEQQNAAADNAERQLRVRLIVAPTAESAAAPTQK